VEHAIETTVRDRMMSYLDTFYSCFCNDEELGAMAKGGVNVAADVIMALDSGVVNSARVTYFATSILQQLTDQIDSLGNPEVGCVCVLNFIAIAKAIYVTVRERST
jgi:hypothetical protein